MKYLKQWLPAEALRIARHYLGYGSYFCSNFKNWEEAKSCAKGYDAENILDLALATALKIKAESVMHSVHYAVIATLMRAAVISGGRLNVIDFGGALGNLYFRARPWLRDLASLTWNIVEQPHYVQAGNDKLADSTLSFFNSIQDASRQKAIDAVIFSGVIQYIDAPESILVEAISCNPRFIIIDRVPIISGTIDRIRIQKTQFPYPIRSSYATRLFAHDSISRILEPKYKLISEFDSFDDPMGGIKRVDFKGFIFERI